HATEVNIIHVAAHGRQPAGFDAGAVSTARTPRVLQLELHVLDVREPDLLQAARAAASVLGVDLLERLVDGPPRPWCAGPGLLGAEGPGGVAGGPGAGQVPDAVLVRRADRGGVAEAGAGVDDDASRARRLCLGARPDPWLPPLGHLTLQACGQVRTGLSDLVPDVAFDRALGDAQQLGDRAGAFHLPDQVPHLGGCALGCRAGEGLVHRGVQAVPEQAHLGRLSYSPSSTLVTVPSLM